MNTDRAIALSNANDALKQTMSTGANLGVLVIAVIALVYAVLSLNKERD